MTTTFAGTVLNGTAVRSLLGYAAAYLGGVQPFHWLDFVNNRALYAGLDVGDVTQATGYSFTRASQGYYENADGTLTLFGYNLLTRSQEFDNAAWTKDGTQITSSNNLAPDGTMTAALVTAETGDLRLYALSTIVNGTTYTTSFFLKQGTAGSVRFQLINIADSNANFNFSTKVLTVDAPYTGGTAQELANGWYRISLT